MQYVWIPSTWMLELLMKKRRLSSYKIPDIKALRGLIKILGMFHVTCYYVARETKYHYDSFNQLTGTSLIDKEYYGIGLKEAKDYVESKFDYYVPTDETEEDKARVVNMIQKIKQLRKFMHTLNVKFHIQSADYGLAACKRFVDRHPR